MTTQHKHAPAVSRPHAPLHGLQASVLHRTGARRTPAAFSREREVRSSVLAATRCATAALRLPTLRSVAPALCTCAARRAAAAAAAKLRRRRPEFALTMLRR